MYRVFPESLRDVALWDYFVLSNMATRFPASASMQKMANNPQQASMFQRTQFQQQPYGVVVSFNAFDGFSLSLYLLRLR